MSLKLILAIVGVTIAALLFFPSGESVAVRYRATAMIVVDGKEYSGSTVRETSYTDTPNSLSGFSASVRDKGEAIAVDLGEGRNPVYVLLNDREGSKHFPFLVTRCFGLETGVEANSVWIAALRRIAVGSRCSLTGTGLPMFKRVSPLVVAFRDEAVPKSIFEVTPDAYAEAFGDRAVLVEIELTRVDPATPLDRRIDQRLPWLNRMPFDGTNVRTLDPHMPRDLPRSRASLAHKVTDYYFRD